MLRSPWLDQCLSVILLAAVFCLPALYNRHPLIYPDSVGYFHSGSAAIDALFNLKQSGPGLGLGLSGTPAYAAEPGEHSKPDKSMAERSRDGTSTSRSPYYGAGLVILTNLGGEWALPLVQVLISVIALLLAARHLGRPGKTALLLVAAAIGLMAGLGIVSTTVMPDVFAGLAILALGILLTSFRSLSATEQFYWVLLLLASCLFHKANLATSAVMVVCGIGYLWLTGHRDRRLAVILAGTLAVATLGHSLVNLAVERASGHPPIQTPFLLARLVGDGTAELYLKRHCPERQYRLCHYLPQMPMTENDFLWGSVKPKRVMKTASAETQQQISEESGEIIKGVLTEFPLDQARASARNILRQTLDVGVTEYGLAVDARPQDVPGMEATLVNYRTSRIAQGEMPLGAISAVMLTLYLAGFAVLAVMLAAPGKVTLPRRSWEIAAILVAGVVINAAISGVIAGVFDRYQGRVAWLIPFVAALLWLQSRAGSTTSVPRAR